MRRKSKAAVLLVIMALLTAACTSTPPAATPTATKEEPYPITMFNLFDSNEPPGKDTAAQKKIEEFTNAKLTITWSPGAGYNEQVNAMLASGDLPKLFVVLSQLAPPMVDAINAGAFWEIEPYLKDYPNLNKNISHQVYDNLRINGKLYSVPKTRPVVKDGIIIRQDWLDKLGLELPKTLDQLLEVARAFTNNDPDGNGKKDTFGVLEQANAPRIHYLTAAVGGGNGWDILPDGTIAPSHLSQEHFKVMQFFRTLYAENLMNRDFPLLNLANRWEIMNRNVAGIMFTDPEQINRFDDLRKIAPDAKFTAYAALDNPKGHRSNLSQGYNGSYFIPTKAVKSEEELRRVLKFLDDLASIEMTNYFVWGEEGVHYSLNSEGKAQRTKEQLELYTRDIFLWERGVRVTENANALPPVLDEEQQTYHDTMKYMGDKLVANPALTFVTPTQTQKGNELTTLWQDARTKFIVGELDEAGWWAAMEQWRNAGGNQLIKEMNEVYAAQKK